METKGRTEGHIETVPKLEIRSGVMSRADENRSARMLTFAEYTGNEETLSDYTR